jgi:hypothetical protein
MSYYIIFEIKFILTIFVGHLNNRPSDKPEDRKLFKTTDNFFEEMEIPVSPENTRRFFTLKQPR